MTDLVNNDGRWFEWVVDEGQSGIELFDEGEIRRSIGDLLREGRMSVSDELVRFE